MCAVRPRHLGKGALPPPVASPSSAAPSGIEPFRAACGVPACSSEQTVRDQFVSFSICTPQPIFFEGLRRPGRGRSLSPHHTAKREQRVRNTRRPRRGSGPHRPGFSHPGPRPKGDFALPLETHRPKSLRALWKPDEGMPIPFKPRPPFRWWTTSREAPCTANGERSVSEQYGAQRQRKKTAQDHAQRAVQ
ncbi:hypothetical protein DEA8626_01431 [Defluviimonas aquaemixtae]|uniref:Uncharacterized protein n=1 Tax=Albidovulum aquaemixtae TaxID=1542388 RepID=A0A2R8B5U1_9RHOB|nr:hypothetical protein DEA8626_01431 [Defluviimonas aquaemixtae]